MTDIHKSIDNIAETIKSRPCVLELKRCEEMMELDEEVIRLANVFSRAQIEYSDGLKHYEEGSKELDDLYRKLKDAKFALDCHPLVMKYYDLFSEVNEPLNYIQFKLISLFTNTRSNCK